MIAKLKGKSNIYNFKIEIFADIKAFDFLKVNHYESGEVLCQVKNIERDGETLIGDCKIIGFRENGVLNNIRTPFGNDAEIEIATDNFIEEVVGLSSEEESFIGVLEHHPDLRISLDFKKTITKHIAVLAKSGAGKSYTVGVLLEEVMKKKIPIVILDPHNEYSSIKYQNSDKRDLERLTKFNLKPEGFLNRVKEYSPDTETNPQSNPITLDIDSLKPNDLINSLPQKLTPAQQSLIFNILSNMSNRLNFDELIFNISNEESNSKWSLISSLEQLKKLKLYSQTPTPLQEIVKFEQTSIISLKGVEPYVTETFVSGLLKELFEARKKEEIPPFLLVLEEAHNFCPERGFGELKTSKIIRTIAGEGRKFGIGLCVISQRPAKVDKNVVSQCTTQILLKMTNPNDIKSVIASSEGVDSSSENEIAKLNIGTCLLTGVIDIPLKVNIRPRISKHGGDTVDITLPYETEELKRKSKKNEGNGLENKEESSTKIDSGHDSKTQEEKQKKNVLTYANNEFVQFIAPEIDIEDAKIMLDSKEIETRLVPALLVKIKNKNNEISSLLINKVNLEIIKTLFPYSGSILPEVICELSKSEKKLLETILQISDKFNPAELLIKTNMMFNEILRICESLFRKGILKKLDREFEISSLKFAKKIEELNFLGKTKFEEIEYDIKLEEKYNKEKIEKLLNVFSNVVSVQEIFILAYVGK